MKNRRAAAVALTTLAALVVFIADLYFNVGGGEIGALLENSGKSTVQIKKSYETPEKSDLIRQVILTGEQTEALISLLENTKFKRITSRTIPFSDRDRYIITATAENREFLRAESYGGEFVKIDYSPEDASGKYWTLRIKNDGWKAALEEILALSD